MKTEKLSGDISTAYGQALSTPVKYEGSVSLYETPDEVRAANDWPSNDEIVNFVNRNRSANERQKLMKAALDAAGYKKPTLEDPAVQFATIVKALVASGKTQEQAEQIARASLGQ